MTNSRITLWLAMALLLISGAAVADHHEEAGGGNDMAQAMASAMALAQPGDCHKPLGAQVGQFNVKMKIYPGPGAPAIEADGTSEGAWILGGRFVETNYSATIMGQPFEGQGVEGFDNQTKEYTGTWRDTMGTYTLVFKGNCDGENKGRTMLTNMKDPMGNDLQNRGVTTATDTGYTYESYIITPDGGEFKNLELVATRK
ncbi:MAG: DUF1579 family protein [Acidobacteriota bacterium]